jgi:hypothetical protein
MHHNAVTLVVMAKNQQVIAQLRSQFADTIRDCLLLGRKRRVHEINGAHWE